MDNSIALNLITLIIIILITLALRPVYNWYCKQDELLKINEKILEEMRLIRVTLEKEDKNKEEAINFKAER
jgi:cytochrome c oxidase assembly protein Cox11